MSREPVNRQQGSVCRVTSKGWEMRVPAFLSVALRFPHELLASVGLNVGLNSVLTLNHAWGPNRMEKCYLSMSLNPINIVSRFNSLVGGRNLVGRLQGRQKSVDLDACVEHFSPTRMPAQHHRKADSALVRHPTNEARIAALSFSFQFAEHGDLVCFYFIRVDVTF
jgi:hypothetical protein